MTGSAAPWQPPSAQDRLALLRRSQTIAIVGASDHPVYPSLSKLPWAPDIVDAFQRPDDMPTVLDESMDVGARALWMHLGITHADTAQRADDAGMSVVMDRCIKIEHARLHGGLHYAGFDTGVISSRRRLP